MTPRKYHFKDYMTDKNGQPISWLDYRSQVTGKSVEELRQEMRERSAKADKSKAGFASMDKERLIKVASKGGTAGLGIKRGKKANSSKPQKESR